MNIILLSGGSGKRLWPLSNDVRSKQFIKIFKKQNKAPRFGPGKTTASKKKKKKKKKYFF